MRRASLTGHRKARLLIVVAVLTGALWSPAVRAERGGTPQPPAPGAPQSRAGLKLKTPEAGVRLYGADCSFACWLSAFFAPAVVRDRASAVPVINLSTEPVIVSAKFVPTNGLAMTHLPALVLSPMPPAAAAPANMLADAKATATIASGDTAQLKLELASAAIPSGLYSGQIQLQARPVSGNADPIMQIATVELRIRDSAIWALLTVVLGIVLGRVAQLVYDPQVIARVRLLDWVQQLESRIAGLQPGAARNALQERLANLRVRVLSRSTDVTALEAEFRTLETDVNNASVAAGGAIIAAIAPPLRPRPQGALAAAGAGVGGVLRTLAGVTPLSVQSVHDWLLPVFVLLTLIFMTIVFMVQQYGGAGAAETFGAGGIADYAALFLAGVASEAITGGLRTLKLK